MYLKKLEMQGFKSFADKLTLDFGAGITTVVGPNGSGKSNISDAVRWVLGEQSAKSLRGGKMEDVIFVGTESRRAVGFAEVSLVIDNTDEILPIEFQEVKVTRRLFRSGESEYFINMSPCRLKDIQQLFFDTGIGVDGYSIIGQGQVDGILSGRVEERRAIFEEASGIMKYKTRKTEAERKLALTTQNIERITDIVNELEIQIEPLFEQSETAKKYLAFKEELKDYEISVYVDSIGKINKQLNDISEKYENVRCEIDSQNEFLEELKAESEEKNIYFKELEEKLETIRGEYYESEKQISEYNAGIKVLEGKINAVEADNARIKDEIREKISLKEILRKKSEEYSGEIQRFEKNREEEASKLKELEDKYSYVMSLMSDRAKNAEVLRDKLSALNKAHGDETGRISALNQMISAGENRKREIEKEIEGILSECREMEKIEEEGKNAEEEFEEKIALLKKESEKYTSIKNQNESRLEELRQKASELSSEYQFKTSKLNLLSEMDAKLEGYQKSVKEIISSAQGKENFTKGIKGTVAQLIDVEKKYELAIETALGQAFQYIVTDSEHTAKSAIEYLRKNNMGRATFLPMTAVNGKTLEKEIVEKLQKTKGYIGLGYEIISYDKEYHNIMLSQLGKVAIADDLDNAVDMAREFGYGFKIITLKGDIIRPSGAMTGGSQDKAVSSGILGRKREIEELTQRTKELSREVKEMNGEAVACTVKISNSAMEAGKLDAECRGLEIKLVEARSVRERAKDRYEYIQSRKHNLETDMENIDTEGRRILGEIEEIHKNIQSIEEKLEDTQSKIEECEKENSAGRAAVDAMNRELTDKKLSVNSILHKIESIKENLQREQKELEETIRSVEAKELCIEDNLKIMDEMKAAEREMESVVNKYAKEKSGKGEEVDKLALEKQTVGDELLGAANKIADTSKKVYMLQEEYNRFEVKKAKLEAESENCRSKLWEDYEITYMNAAEYVKDKDLGSYTSMQRYINEVRGKIKELGDVNVNAIEDYKNTKERLEFLNTQMEDLEASKIKLEKIIHDMSVIMKKQFVDHFELINQSFNSVFRELFEGGRANVFITDKDNVLESPIEIEVQPPGKKLQNMMLLSGGEKALTAIALLFAVLRLKPTPFCILDEIEAALDDTNVIRFAEYVTKFSDNTQFVIITHRKGTMEAADVIYGVTMEERGVSKVVSMKFNK